MANRDSRRERMRGVLKRWQRSGQSAAAFCRQEGIEPQKLSYWKRVLGLAGPVVRRRVAARRGVEFVPVRLVGTGEGVRTGAIEVVLAGGERVVVGEGASRELLREVLAMLRERC